jgi:hypothetical protein
MNKSDEDVILNDYGQATCPQRALAEIADLEETGTLRTCGADVHVVWESYVPFGDDQGSFEPKDANVRQWRVECESGHVLARNDGQEEWATPPTWEQMIPILSWNGGSAT